MTAAVCVRAEQEGQEVTPLPYRGQDPSTGPDKVVRHPAGIPRDSHKDITCHQAMTLIQKLKPQRCSLGMGSKAEWRLQRS